MSDSESDAGEPRCKVPKSPAEAVKDHGVAGTPAKSPKSSAATKGLVSPAEKLATLPKKSTPLPPKKASPDKEASAAIQPTVKKTPISSTKIKSPSTVKNTSPKALAATVEEGDSAVEGNALNVCVCVCGSCPRSSHQPLQISRGIRV